MQYSFIGDGFGSFVLGRKLLKSFPQAKIQLFLTTKVDETVVNQIKESDFWECGFEQLLQKTRFGRIGIFCDRKNIDFQKFFDQKIVNIAALLYEPKEKKRALKCPEITLFQTQVVREFANEGLADSVEFRRLMRKFIRRAKHSHCDTLFFPELIFGETKTKKILQHLAGSQMRVFTGDDFFVPENVKNDERDLTVFYKENEGTDFLKKRAEQILCTKMSENDFQKQS